PYVGWATRLRTTTFAFSRRRRPRISWLQNEESRPHADVGPMLRCTRFAEYSHPLDLGSSRSTKRPRFDWTNPARPHLTWLTEWIVKFVNAFLEKKMNGMRKVISFLMVLMLAAFAMPVMAAPQKTYRLLLVQVSPVTPLKATRYVKNESPPPNSANSNIGSFTITLAGFTVDTSQPVDCPGALCSATANTVTVTNISPPIQQQGIFGVTFSVSTCGEASVASATVATGSNLTGGTFAPKSDSDFFNGNPPGVSSSSTATFICGSLACNTGFTVPNLACTSTSTDLDCVSGYRGNNKDGLCSGSVNYAVTNDLAFADK